MTTNYTKMLSNAVKHWYLPLIAGIIFIGLGIMVFYTPLESYLALAFIFSISFFASGVSEMFFAGSNRNKMDGWGWHLGMGMLTAIFGLILINNPTISLVTLPFIVGFVVMFRSVTAISTSLDMRNHLVKDWGILLALGIFGVIFSFILIASPGFSGFSLVFWTGMALIVQGVYSFYYSIRLKKIQKLAKSLPDELKAKLHLVQEEIKDELAK